jgi:tetratricopeptide (TPR) repeat protein
VALLPVIGLVQIGAQAAADRYTYLPFVGLFWVLAWGGSELAGRRPRAMPWLAGAGVIWLLLILSATVSQVGYWKNSERLFGRALAVTKDNAQAENGYGLALLRSGRAAEAIAHFQAAVRIWPNYFIGWANLGTAFFRVGQLPQATACLTRADQISTGDPEIIETLAECYLQEGQPQKGEASLKQVVALQPDRLGTRLMLGRVLASQGKRQEALAQFREILKRDPRDVPALSALGQVQLELDVREEAAASFRAALKLDPGAVAALTGLARTLAVPGAGVQDLEEAVVAARRACEATRYESLLPLQALLAAYEAAGRTTEAERLKASMRSHGLHPSQATPGPGVKPF